jgi:F-type H+-transporting ATPase subunit delta
LADVVGCIRADDAFAAYLSSPIVEKGRRAALLEKAFRGRVSDLVLHSILVLNRKGAADLVSLVRDRFVLALERKRNEVEVYVTTAVPLTEAHRKRLGEMVVQYTGRKPRFMEKVDPRVIAGLRIQVDDFLLDDTAAYHVRNLRHKLFERASRQLHKG